MTRRSFDNLRPSKRPPDREKAAIDAAAYWVAMQPQGQIFLDWLRSETTFFVPPPDASDGALRANVGNRQLMEKIEQRIISGRRRKSGDE